MTVTTGSRVLAYGGHALLQDCDSPGQVSTRYLPSMRRHIEAVHAEPSYDVERPAVADVALEIVYDGTDLADVSARSLTPRNWAQFWEAR